jgi:hypothetical protein
MKSGIRCILTGHNQTADSCFRRNDRFLGRKNRFLAGAFFVIPLSEHHPPFLSSRFYHPPAFVIPAKAGIQSILSEQRFYNQTVDSCFRRNDRLFGLESQLFLPDSFLPNSFLSQKPRR